MKKPGSKTVLVVDDDADVRNMICAMLGGSGYTTVAAGNGKEALACLRSSAGLPRMILLDMMMPEMSGWEFLSIKTMDPALAAIPVAIITAVSTVKGQAPELNAVDVLIKPSRMESLMALVDRLCA